MKHQKNRKEIICRCNNISRATIEEAIRNGCRTLNEIYDATTAGVGPCGGSCRRKIAPILSTYLETGAFPPSSSSNSSSTPSDPTQPSKKDPTES